MDDVITTRWGQRPESVVRRDRYGRLNGIELLIHGLDVPVGVLQWPDVYMLRLSKNQARLMGAALTRVSNKI